MRFHVLMISFLSHMQTLALAYSQKIKIKKKNSSGLEITPIPGRVFQTFQMQGIFWPTSEKLL